ncbi:trypsin-like peptidase domain-containing protein [Nocardioides sp. Y6]|uniref:Trypsin-like peptidase domain-containing protein n=1 Tax=Nocardioides malaquae TaxID=2773426 RepID=A0ABR9RRP1_9ACTN|nr:trypsin-like peptidase domain-containing protein [Nocardioides malaquae]MBE7323820.1 trypsin-like peptidase domain-containing protein [Nocardioides malaquae]
MIQEPTPSGDFEQARPAVPYGPALPPAYGQVPHPPHAPSHLRESTRPGVPGWIWPAVALLSLVLGLVGGALGAGLQERLDAPGLGLGSTGTRSAPPLEAGNSSVAAVAGELLPSTVQVLASSGDNSGTGSGFVLDTSGHVVTNNHVVAAAADGGRVQVVDHRGRVHEAEVVGRSQVYDLAVLRADGVEGMEPASLGSSVDLLVGEPVVAFGAPLGLSQTVTSGIVSAKDRPVTTGSESDANSFINAVQTDAAINPGNSGGPLVDIQGRVVGVNTAIATTGGFLAESGNIGVGFAIPIEQVKVTADQILRTGEARYPVIGARVDTRSENELAGAVISEVMSGSPAQSSGLRDNDLVVAVDGTRVTDGIALIVRIRTFQPGDTVEFTVRRGGDERTVSITLGSEVG